MKEPNEANRYHIRTASTKAEYQELEKWAHDPNCIEMELCVQELARRQKSNEPCSTKPEPLPGYQDTLKSSGVQKTPTLPARADEWQRPYQRQDTFNPRTEVSADARHIVKHLWIIFVLLPFVCALLVYLLK
jgi:hypothetical protein